MHVFLSWSGTRSKRIAAALAEFLPAVHPDLQPWMSESTMAAQDWRNTIGAHLSHASVGIICITPENAEAPWLMYEAGVLHGIGAEVCPLVYGLLPEAGPEPIRNLQAKTLDRDGIWGVVNLLNSKLPAGGLPPKPLELSFNDAWPMIEGKLDDFLRIKIAGIHLRAILDRLQVSGGPPQHWQVISFQSGFETHYVYDVVGQAARERLWLFGRKNRKLFDKSHKSFFSSLRDRVAAGLDFRVLFLDPTSPAGLLAKEHVDFDFAKQLADSFSNASSMLQQAGLKPGDHFRTYQLRRRNAVIVVDNLVLFSPIEYDDTDRVLPLTDNPFQIVAADSRTGQQLVAAVDGAWGKVKLGVMTSSA